MRRYHCRDAGCGWHGLLPRRSIHEVLRGRRSTAVQPALWRELLAWPQLRVGLAFLAAGAAAVATTQLAMHLYGGPPAVPAPPRPPVLAAGESHDGEPLPARHPWLRPVALAPADDPAAGARAGEPAAAAGPDEAVPPLAMRRGCAWGKPGRNPFRGSVEQALLHARLPREVVRDIARQVREHRPADQLEIRTGRIHGVRHGREFDPQGFAMAFGDTLCLNSRVNFAPGHVERADLYEARDARGDPYAVMVPEVCGNVSVLGERGEKRRPAALRGDGESPRRPPWRVLLTGADPSGPSPAPEPGSLALALLALAAAGVARGRRRAALACADGGDAPGPAAASPSTHSDRRVTPSRDP